MLMNIRQTVAASTILLAISGVNAANASPINLLQNGGFENNPGITTTYYNIGTQVGSNGGGPDHPVPPGFGWTVSNGNVDIISYDLAGYGPAPANGGSFGLDLVGYGSTGTISQDISTAVGQRYNVSFQYENNWASITDPTAQVLVSMTIDGNEMLSPVGLPVAPTGGQNSWQTFNGSFVATDSDTTFELSELFGANNGGVFLDNVSVTSVPEPATWAVMLLGMIGMGFTMLGIRRKSANAKA
jgi:hypothetical protein